MWRSQAEAEGLTLLEAVNKTGYFGVYHRPGRSKPYQAEVRRGGKKVSLGHFATAERRRCASHERRRGRRRLRRLQWRRLCRRR